jgi:2-polyprenyl-3-methyl-5-hydroxy-6-metoxy-1,4-benzoquinol methylase
MEFVTLSPGKKKTAGKVIEMYITKVCNKDEKTFDWGKFFYERGKNQVIDKTTSNDIVFLIRKHLKESNYKMGLMMNVMIENLLNKINIENSRILELGAATGFLTRFLIAKYNCSGVLIDKNEESYHAYLKSCQGMDVRDAIEYYVEDVFKFKSKEKYDLVCSFGLIEHFYDKQKIMNVHKKFVKPGGIIMILVPLDTPLTRVFYEVHQELNPGYRELLNKEEFCEILVQSGLKIIKTEISHGYVYDIIGSIGQLL